MLGGHVYTEGGQLTQHDNKADELIQIISNATLSIDVSKSWDSAPVVVNLITRAAEVPRKVVPTSRTGKEVGIFSMWGRAVQEYDGDYDTPMGVHSRWCGWWQPVGCNAQSRSSNTNPKSGRRSSLRHRRRYWLFISVEWPAVTELGRRDAEAIQGMVQFDTKTGIIFSRNVESEKSPFKTLQGVQNHLVPIFGGDEPSPGIPVWAGEAKMFDLQIHQDVRDRAIPVWR
ncbi:hypothetical protein VTH82DRAFT_6983 [Thermothelomyces myriococcoides]